MSIIQGGVTVDQLMNIYNFDTISGAGTIVPSLTTIASKFGKIVAIACLIRVMLIFL